MQTDYDYEELEERLLSIVQEALSLAKGASTAASACRLLPKLRGGLSERQHREFLCKELVKVAQQLDQRSRDDLRALIFLAEQIGIGLEGQKSRRRLKKQDASIPFIKL